MGDINTIGRTIYSIYFFARTIEEIPPDIQVRSNLGNFFGI